MKRIIPHGKIKYLFPMLALTCLLAGCELVDDVKAKLFPPEETETETSEEEQEDTPVIVINTDDISFDIKVEEVVTPTPTPFVYEEIHDDENRIYSVPCADLNEVTLCFIGDICFAEGYSVMSELYKHGDGILGCIAPEILQGLSAADIFMANNEFPYSSRGSARAGKQFTFRAKPESVSYLQDMQVDIVSLANNHAYDYGEEALTDTFDILKGAGIPFVGAGMNIEEAMKPVYFKANGRTIAFTSGTQIERTGNPDTKEATADSPGVLRTLDPGKMVKCIEEAETQADFVIVYVHWGSENTDLVEESQRKLAEAYVAAGADLIIGDHSHCLQGIDYIGDVPVFYSLGNFWFNSRTIDTGYARVVLNTVPGEDAVTIKTVEFVPCIQRGCHTYTTDESDKARILSYLQGISDHAAVSPEGIIERSETNHNTQNGQNTSPSKAFIRTTPEPSPEGDAGTELTPEQIAQILQQQQAAAEQAAQGEE